MVLQRFRIHQTIKLYAILRAHKINHQKKQNMLIIEYPKWVVDHKNRYGEYPEEFQHMFEVQNSRALVLAKELHNSVVENPDYDIYLEKMDADMNDYERGTIIAISENRENFDYLYGTDVEYNYRGGFREIKVGKNFVLYGFEFD